MTEPRKDRLIRVDMNDQTVSIEPYPDEWKTSARIRRLCQGHRPVRCRPDPNRQARATSLHYHRTAAQGPTLAGQSCSGQLGRGQNRSRLGQASGRSCPVGATSIMQN